MPPRSSDSRLKIDARNSALISVTPNVNVE